MYTHILSKLFNQNKKEKSKSELYDKECASKCTSEYLNSLLACTGNNGIVSCKDPQYIHKYNGCYLKCKKKE